jgi:hypothetical protein
MESLANQLSAILGLCIVVFLTNLIIPIGIVGFNSAKKWVHLLAEKVKSLRK